ncbi:MAG: hypothetical protein AAFU77_14805 [Myxococcota bacterium]
MELLVPLTFITVVGAVLAFALALRAGTRRRTLTLLRDALRDGASLDRGTVEAINAGRVNPYDDLRRGVLFLAFCGALVGFSFVLGDGVVVRGLALFPGAVGVSYLGFHLARLG